MVRDCPASLSHLANDCPTHYHFFTFCPWELTPGPKFTKLGGGLQLPYFSPITQTVYEICITNFSLFGLTRLTPEPKFTKSGDDQVPSQIYYPAKFHRPASTHAGYIHYKTLRTNKESYKQ